MHTLLIGEFLRRAELKAGEDIPLVVLPPQFMAASLANGQIDGFCAGAPWNALAVALGPGRSPRSASISSPTRRRNFWSMRADEVGPAQWRRRLR